MKKMSEQHIHSVLYRLRHIVLLAVIGCGVLAAAPAAHAACLQAPVWAAGPVGDITDPQPTFSWAPVPGATSYTLYVLGAADDGPIYVHRTGITSTSFRPSDSLSAYTPMRWKVKAEAPCGAGLYASGGTFRIVPAALCPPTVAPTLFGPEGTIREAAPTFCWTPVPGASEYVIALLYAADDGDYVFGHAISTEDTCINLGPLPVNTPMRWKIKTECNELYGPFSPSKYFTIVP